MKKLIIASLFLATFGTFAQEKPNFLIIYTDDQGYQDVGVFGAKGIKTPNIDNLAKEGLQGTSFYVSASLCTPSRAALQTAKYHFNIELYNAANSSKNVYLPYTTTGMPKEEITIAEVLAPVAYKTALIGKWHLGHLDEFLPTAQGYQHFYGIPFSHDLWLPENMKFAENIKYNEGYTEPPQKPYETKSIEKLRDYKVPLMLGNEVIEYPAINALSSEQFATESIRFIDESKTEGKPFYICLCFPMPHNPPEASEKFIGSSERGAYGDAVQELDFNIGRIVEHLKAQELFDNTLIVFTSDNGPRLGGKGIKLGSALPLKNGKGSLSEGGHRVPFVLSFPKLVKAGRLSDDIIANMDLLPTLAELAGAEIPEGIDGLSLVKFLSDENENSPRNEFLFAKSGYKEKTLLGIRIDDWKLIKEGKGFSLYNLKTDISEKKNLIKQNPEKAQELMSILADRQKTFNAKNAGKSKKKKK